MNVYYNQQGIGDTLIVVLEEAEIQKIQSKKKGHVTRIFESETGRTVGFNIFQASEYLKVNGNGRIEITEVLVEHINKLIRQQGFTETIEFDFSPKFVVGYVMEKEKHPNADKLSVCKVDIGEKVLQIVCGAPNVEAGQKVVVAKVGAVMPSGLLIKDAELRGVASSGMICSAKELDLPNAPQEKGILVLSDEYTVGQPFGL